MWFEVAPKGTNKQTNKQTNRNNKRVYHWTLLLDTSDCYNSSSSSNNNNNNNNSQQKRRCGNFILKPLNLFSNNDHTDKSTSENNVYWSKLSEKYFLSSSELCNSINKHMVNSVQGVGASPRMALWDACQIVKSGNLWHEDSYFFIRSVYLQLMKIAPGVCKFGVSWLKPGSHWRHNIST